MMVRALLILCFILTQVSHIFAAELVSIGVILPLSGKFEQFGNNALQGIELALEQYNSKGLSKKHPVRLLVRDSRGVPEEAEKAVIELDKEGAVAILGPILGSTSEAAAKKAQGIGIPIITMTQKEGITEIGDWVFRDGLTNKAQVKGVAEYEIKEKKKFAILYPENPYGKEMSALFTAEVEKRGGKVVSSKGYKEGQTDFGPEIKGLAGMKLDAIFIPDYPERVGLIIPQLAFYDMKGIRLLGISSWNSQKLIDMAGDYMKNAVFVDGFFAESQRPNVKDFVKTYQKTYGTEPGILEALAFDTAGIVLSIASEGVDSREDIKKRILKVKDYQGVSGDITFGERDAERSLFLLMVKSGRIEEVAP